MVSTAAQGDDGDPKHGQPQVAEQSTYGLSELHQQNEYLAELKKNKPGYILQAQIEFEREYRAAGGSSSFFGQESRLSVLWIRRWKD